MEQIVIMVVLVVVVGSGGGGHTGGERTKVINSLPRHTNMPLKQVTKTVMYVCIGEGRERG